ncbi:MAG: hypothetical protein ACOH14_06110 [Rhodoglobus sp.]
MSDELIISGGGSVSIATDEMLSSASDLQRAAEMTKDIAGSVQMVDDRLTVQQMELWGIPAGAVLVESDLDRIYCDLHTIAQRAEELSGLVRLAAQTYGWTEAFAETVLRELSADAAALLGYFFPIWATAAAALALTSPVIPLLAGLGIGWLVLGGNTSGLLDSDRLSTALNELITDPVFVLALRHWVMTLDEFGTGLAGLPPILVSALSTAGVIGLSSSAGFIQKLGGIAGVLKETPVELVGKTAPAPVVPAQSLEERVQRIPQPTDDEPWQVRIETITTPGEPDRFSVYVSGTVDFTLSNSDQPWDSTSNLSLAAQQDSAAVAAVAEAMREAGITSESEVELTGHSQGAAVAARLAESRQYNITGLLTVGGNIGQIDIPSEVPTIIIEHTDDIVPAIGGIQDNRDALLVEREAFAGRTLPEGVPVPAHQRSEYEETARLVDASDSPEVHSAIQSQTHSDRSGTAATVTTYQFERVGP